jgi:hypothetical protein
MNIQWVRAIISLIGILGVTVGFFMKIISGDAYLGVVTMTIVWWYKSRDEEKIQPPGGTP